MSRRGQNEGSIYKREDGRWAGTLSLGYELGKRRRKTFYGATRKEVQQKLATALSDLQGGLPIPVGRQSVRQYLVAWLNDVVRPSVRLGTYESYERLLRVQVFPIIGRIPLTKLGPQDLVHLYGSMLRAGSAPRTVQYAHAILHRALKQAVRWNLVARNPVDAVDSPRPAKIEIRPLNAQEASALLEAASGDRLHALYVLAITTGMRQGELLGLRWDDINWMGQQLHVRRQVRRLNAGVIFNEPKTARGRRVVTLSDLAVRALRTHRSVQLEERLCAGAHWTDGDLVFPNSLGRPLQTQNLIRRSFRPLLLKAGLPRIRFHDLRHTAATLLLMQGVHPKVVQELLGHATIAVTMDVYSHVMPSLQREAASKLDALFATI
jgi:integrase